MDKSVSRKWIVSNGMVLIAPWDYDLVQNLKSGKKFRIDPGIRVPEGHKKIDFRPLPPKCWSLEIIRK